MGTHEQPNVLIVGAGPTGLILAHELLRRGVSVRLAEKRQGPSHTTRAFTLHARTMEMFEHIGVAHRLEEVCLPCPGNVYHFQGLAADQLPRTDFRTLPSRYAFYYKLNQNDFEQVLREHLVAQYSLVPEYQTEVVSVTEVGEQVEVRLCRADTGEIEVARYDWVVGCDGSKSRVREEAGIGFTGSRVGVMAMMDVEISGFSHDDSWVNYFISRDLFMLVTKLPGRYWRVYLSDAGAMTAAGNPRRSFQRVADEMGIGMVIGEPQWATQWEILNNIADRYRKGRVLVCGDASHVHSPAGGQGMNGCMQDAFNVGWKLAAIVNGSASADILDTYERERRPIGEQISAGAKATHDIVMAFGTGLADRIAITRQPEWQDNSVRLISGLAHNYRDAVRVPPGLAAVPGPAAGERAPDALLTPEPGKRLFDLLRHPRFTLLASPGDGKSGQADIIAKVFADLTSRFPGKVACRLITSRPAAGFDIDSNPVETTGEFPARYEIGAEGRLVLVRPDMYVGLNAALGDAARLPEYLGYWYSETL
ncbi:MAG TPA: FAD-dependent monooxygenase [Trebonia sp.]|jgi:NADPH-dependent dioxygenase